MKRAVAIKKLARRVAVLARATKIRQRDERYAWGISAIRLALQVSWKKYWIITITSWRIITVSKH